MTVMTTQVALSPNGKAPDPLATAVPLALTAGWTMGVLFGRLPVQPAGQPPHLPTLHELPDDERRLAELGRLKHVLANLGAAPGLGGSGLPEYVPEMRKSLAEFRLELADLNYKILTALTTFGPEIELAYELGRSLHDTANPPGDDSTLRRDLQRQLCRERIARIQEWLAVLAAHLPKSAAAVVSASIGRWSEFAGVTIGQPTGTPDSTKPGDLERQIYDLLVRQGDTWLMLLVGTESTAKLLSAEGYVAAGEAAIGRSAKIAGNAIRRYWYVAVALVAALGGLLYLAVAFTSGAAMAWTSIASIAGTFGISGKSLSSAVTRLGEEADGPLLVPAQEDAMAWTITTLPCVKLRWAQERKLRRAGVPRSAGLGHF